MRLVGARGFMRRAKEKKQEQGERLRDGRGHGWRERGSGEQPSVKPMQGGIRQAKQSTKPVPPAPVAGDPQMKRIDTFFTFVKLHAQWKRQL